MPHKGCIVHGRGGILYVLKEARGLTYLCMFLRNMHSARAIVKSPRYLHAFLLCTGFIPVLASLICMSHRVLLHFICCMAVITGREKTLLLLKRNLLNLINFHGSTLRYRRKYCVQCMLLLCMYVVHTCTYVCVNRSVMFPVRTALNEVCASHFCNVTSFSSRFIGQGEFGEVFQGTAFDILGPETGSHPVAIKVYTYSYSISRAHPYRNEANTLSTQSLIHVIGIGL